MSSSTPPTNFFVGINFNPNFYNLGSSAVTFEYLNSHYLKSTDYAISRAIYTQFYGIIYAIGGISGDGSQLSNLNASNVTSGTLTVSRGGIGTNTLSSNQILIGNGTNNIISSSNLTWNNTTNTLSATNFVGSGSTISNLDYNNIVYNKPNLNIYALQTYVDGSLNTINNTLTTKENILSFTTPLIRTTNNITIDLSGYPLKTYVDGSLNTINNTLSQKQNIITVSTPLIKDVSNNVTIDLSAYPIKTYVDGSLNTINNTLAQKQNIITVSTPLIKDVSNNLSIDLSGYPLKTYVDGSLNTINTTKQNNLTFSNPFLNTSNTISLKYNSAQFNIDSSGNLSLLSTIPTQWTTSGSNIYYNTGNVGIKNISPQLTLDVGSNNSNHNIGRAILTVGNIHNADKLDSLSIGRWDGSTTADWQFSGIRYNVTTGAAVGESTSNHSNMAFYTWGNSVWNSKEVMRLTSRGRLGINTTSPAELLDVNGNITCSGTLNVSGTATLNNVLTVYNGNTSNGYLTLTGGANTQPGYISFMKPGGLRAGYIGWNDNNSYLYLETENGYNGYNMNGTALLNRLVTYNNTLPPLTAVNNATTHSMINIFPGINGQQGALTAGAYNIYLSSFAYGTGLSGPQPYITINLTTLYNACNTILTLQAYGAAVGGSAGAKIILNGGNNGGGSIQFINDSTTSCTMTTGGVSMSGTLTLSADNWIYSSDSKTRIYFASNGRTYYQGYGINVLDVNHEWRNNDGTQKMTLDYTGNLVLQGVLVAKFITIANTKRDLTGINYENTNVNDVHNATLYCIQGTFTGFHRVFTEDELYNNDDPQKFKNDYEGRIVVSIGKIATDTTDNGIKDNTEWEILYDKAGITIEDALPKIELSRKKKDKRVFGVLGDKRRNNNRPERLIVNSVGEGGIWVCNSNGNIENGDYITSSDYLGYGEKQDDDILHNYTVAKSTISCDFELDSNLYNCFEIDDLDVNGNNLRVAFISVTYHCG